jgi:molecular chaperone GrpE
VDGIELIRRELVKALERHGVTRYSALGQRFDPNQHEAIARVVSVDKEPDTVVGETVPGYSLRGRVIRPAQVAVAAAPDENAA